MRTGMPRAVWVAVWVAVVVGVAARLVFAFGYWVDKPLTHDEREYLILGHNLARGRGFVYALPDGTAAAGEHFGRAPVYPLLIAGLVRVSAGVGAGAGALSGSGAGAVAPGAGIEAFTDRSPALPVVRGMQAVLGGAIVWIVAWIAWRAAGARAAVAAAALAAVYPPLVWMPAYILSETLYSVLALGGAAVLMRTDPRPRVWVAAGLLAGAAVLTRPAYLFFLLLAGPWLWYRHGLASAVVVALACLAVVLPWTARNATVYGRFVLVASEGGITFWTGNNPQAVGDGDMAANIAIKRANLALRDRHPGLTPEEMEPIYYREGLTFVREQPGAWLGLMVRKLFYTFVPFGPSYRLHSALYFGASVVSYLGVLPFAVLGLMGLVRRGQAPGPLVLLAVSSVLVGVVFFPSERYRIPVMDPALLAFAGAWWGLRV